MSLLRSERNPKPKTFGAIADAAFEAYGKRFPFYAALAVVGFAVQFAVNVATHGREDVRQATNGLYDALLGGAVSYGVFTEFRDDRPGVGEIMDRTIRRAGVLFALGAVSTLIAEICIGGILSPEAQALFGLTIIPTFFFLGLLSLPVVAAAIEADESMFALLRTAIVAPVMAACRLRVLVRVAIAGVLTLPQLLLATILVDVLKAHGIHDAAFWAGTPLDALLVGPYQAFFTIFYLDLLTRQSAAQ